MFVSEEFNTFVQAATYHFQISDYPDIYRECSGYSDIGKEPRQ